MTVRHLLTTPQPLPGTWPRSTSRQPFLVFPPPVSSMLPAASRRQPSQVQSEHRLPMDRNNLQVLGCNGTGWMSLKPTCLGKSGKDPSPCVSERRRLFTKRGKDEVGGGRGLTRQSADEQRKHLSPRTPLTQSLRNITSCTTNNYISLDNTNVSKTAILTSTSTSHTQVSL